ncbi:MAG: uncharacterized protein KVP18_001645 [Porospora cf. gigantea A]|uniref:uncharacterized protein n=1 Tax=Porospora cf. gigantea A TaxID=2853593 RepID=UPI0035597F0E|nr:MAG: hypothetical protein KVP18_001645 [Porospora cf. gigantea A]
MRTLSTAVLLYALNVTSVRADSYREDRVYGPESLSETGGLKWDKEALTLSAPESSLELDQNVEQQLLAGADIDKDRPREVNDFSLQFGLHISPTAVDVAMLELLLTWPAILIRKLLFGAKKAREEVVTSVKSALIDRARQVETFARLAEPVLSSTSEILTGPALKGLLAGPLVAPIGAVGDLLSSAPLLALPALVKVAPVVIGPAITALLTGPAVVPLFALLDALHLNASLAGPILTGVAITVLLVGPGIKSIMASLSTKHIKIMSALIGPIAGFLMSSPLISPLLTHLNRLLAFVTSLAPAIAPFQSLVEVLLSNKTLHPLIASIESLPSVLAKGVGTPSVASAYDFL